MYDSDLCCDCCILVDVTPYSLSMQLIVCIEFMKNGDLRNYIRSIDLKCVHILAYIVFRSSSALGALG